jgi:hypothetical protein
VTRAEHILRRVFFAASNETEMFRVNNRGVVQRNCGRGARLSEDYVTQTEELFLKSPFAKGSGVDDRTGKQVQAET